MNREIQVYHIAEEYCRVLGIPVPEIRVEGGTLQTEPYKLSRSLLGQCGGDYITIRTRGRPLREMRHTIAHELVHKAFRRLQHGPAFENHIKALMSGNLFFRGRFISLPEPSVDGAGRTYWKRGRIMWYVKPQERFTMLDIEMPKEPTTYDERIATARTHLKKLDAHIKLLQSLRTRWLRRQRGLEKASRK